MAVLAAWHIFCMPENPDQTSDLQSVTQKPKKNYNIAMHNIAVYIVICCMQQCLLVLHIQPRTLFIETDKQ